MGSSRAPSLEADADLLAQSYQAQGDMPYMSEPGPMYLGNDYPFGLGDGLTNRVQQTYTFPSAPEGNAFTYPQPPAPLTIANDPSLTDFYTYDQALPFSPTGTSFASQLAQQGLNGGPSVDPLLASQSSYLSPTSGVYPNNSIFRLQVPMSARWDRAHAMLPSSEVALESLGFDNEDNMLLQDFGAALAQADGEW